MTPTRSTITLDEHHLTAAAVVAIARANTPVRLAASCRTHLAATREYIERHWLTDDAPLMYSFNTGVDATCRSFFRPSET